MRKRELVALLGLSSWCLVIVVWLFLAVPWVCLQFVIVVFPDHTHLVFSINFKLCESSMSEDICLDSTLIFYQSDQELSYSPL